MTGNARPPDLEVASVTDAAARKTARWAIALLIALAQPAAPQRTVGVVVVELEQVIPGVEVDVRPDDVLVAWRRAESPESEGALSSPWDWYSLVVREIPRGDLVLDGFRDGQRFTSRWPRESWRLTVRPRLEPSQLDRYLDGKAAVDSGDVESGVEIWIALVEELFTAKRAADAAWLAHEAADALAERRLFDRAQALFDDVLARSRELGDHSLVTQSLTRQGAVWWQRRRLAAARRALEEALALQEQDAAGLALASILDPLGNALAVQGDLAAAEAIHRRLVAIVEAEAPGSLLAAVAHNSLGADLADQVQPDRAEEMYRKSLAIRERVTPDAIEVAHLLNNLASLHRARGELVESESLHRRALAIKERLAPESRTLLVSLSNLGVLLNQRGDLAEAEQLLRHALALAEERFAEELALPDVLLNLALVQRSRGDYAAAESSLERAIDFYVERFPSNVKQAVALQALGLTLRLAGRLDEAEATLERALEWKERQLPGTLSVAWTLDALGEVAADRGDRQAAERLFERALEIRRRKAPGGVLVANSLRHLARVRDEAGDDDRAEELYRQALEIQSALVPGSSEEARTLYRLGRMVQRQGRSTEARELLLAALDSLEEQARRLGGAQEVRAGFAELAADLYRHAIDLLVELGQPAEAFAVLERSRSRVLLAMLAERDLVLEEEVDEDLAAARRRLLAESERLESELQAVDSWPGSEEVEAGRRRLRELRDERANLRERVRRLSPRLAALRDPSPLDLERARSALDSGTLLLAYSLGDRSSLLFALSPVGEGPAGGLEVFSLPLGAQEVGRRVDTLRQLIATRPAGPRTLRLLDEHSRRLYRDLLEPAEERIAAAKRLLICPDGPLYLLPFAALARDRGVASPQGGGAAVAAPEADRQYLVEWKPLHLAPSVTLYAELREQPRTITAPSGPRVLAFGDPLYAASVPPPGASESSPEGRATRSPALPPLPGSAEEVRAISAILGRQAEARLGREATEEEVLARAPSARYLHFACHALLDERFPLSSALALSTPERREAVSDNGLLQAWEIFERLRLNADLVVLSACRTGLGRTAAGEGLIGLTRAFHYAGSRSVMASLWSVSDRSTATLMESFYRRLAEGLSKDEALRAAQVEMLRSGSLGGNGVLGAGSDFTHPYSWAAFVLHGDWAPGARLGRRLAPQRPTIWLLGALSLALAAVAVLLPRRR